MNEFISKWKWLILAFAGIFLVLCLFLFTGVGWAVFRSQETTPTLTREPEAFNYCGAQLTSLCVVSFGRDAFGNTIINLYVPEDTYAPFYLNVIRTSGESRFDCVVNKKVDTSVYCTGTPINLGEGFEIQVIAERNGNLMAQGTFVLTAYLVTTQSAEETAIEKAATEATATLETQATSTPFSSNSRPSSTSTPTQTPTPSTPSYPNYP